MNTDPVSAPIRDRVGATVGQLVLAQLPGRGDRLESAGDRAVVEEEGTYRFSVVGFDHSDSLEIIPGDELFSFDDSSRKHGRMLPRQHVGRIGVRVRAREVEGHAFVSVEPKKLEAVTEYRQMLDDIAEVATEAVLQGFAPASTALEHDAERRPQLLYQQFAFLHARLMGAGERDLALVLNRPHREWVDHQEQHPPGSPMRGSSRNIRALSRPGPRVRAPSSHRLPSLPARLTVSRSEETLDTEPNRFVAFALRRWRELALNVATLLSARGERTTGPISRGLDAADEVIALIDRTLSAPMFRSVGRLGSFPTGNQVLQKRAGYRELLRTFVLTELGAQLALDWDLDDAFAASQRNIATLYEYWAFLQLAKSVGRVCGADLSVRVMEPSTDGMSIGFARGNRNPLSWVVVARGRTLTADLYFNREFLVSARPDASWTRAMRPDCSLRLRPGGLGTDIAPDDLAVWLHFDAKYRVEFAAEQFALPDERDGEIAAEAEAVERLARSKREDLLKMHAYRDAIRRSAGAYVLYPGDEQRTPFMEHHEVLPGLGAFPLRPGGAGAVGAAALDRFLEDVVDHVADRATQHERSRFWRTVIHRVVPARSDRDRRLPELSVPPSDAPVLCGYLRGRPHRRWVDSSGLYNVRAGDSRGSVAADADILRALDIVLYGPDLRPSLWARAGAWFVQSQDEMQHLGYPNPRGNVYLCCPVERRDDEPEWLGQLHMGSSLLTGQTGGAPFATTWRDLLDQALGG
ncbi:MAG: DUF2357 domain-containing protein [Solirubrobacteraceae bacterium]